MRNSKIKIIYTIPNFDTCATGMAMMKLVEKLDRDKFEPVVVCLHNRGERFKLVENSGIEYHIFPYLTPLRPIFKLIYGVVKTALFFRKLKADIVFSYHYSSDYSEALAARLVGAKFAYIKKNMGWQGPSYNQWKIKTFMSNLITVQNTDMMKMFFNGNKRAKLISLGVDLNEFKKSNVDLNLLEELNLDQNDKLLLCVANIIPKKGIDYLLRAFDEFANSNNNWKLIIVGDYENELGKLLISEFNDLIEKNKVKFTGKRYDVSRFYSIADLFILPSTENEGAPVAIQEAMASKVLVLTTNTPGNRDQLSVLPDQLFDPKSETEILNILNKFKVLDSNELNVRIEIQLDFVKKNYSLENEIDQHQMEYLNLMK